MEKKSMLCPQCRKLISSDERVCPYCGTTSPGSLWKQGVLGGFSLFRVDPVKTIITVNVAFYLFSLLFSLLLNPSTLGLSANPMTFLSPADGSLFFLGATGTIAHRFVRTMVDAHFRLVPPRRASSPLLQHDGPQAARFVRSGRIRIPPFRHPLPLDRRCRLLPLLSGRRPFHHRRLRLGLRPDRRNPLLWKKPGGFLWRADLPPSDGVGRGSRPLRTFLPRNQQLGARGRPRFGRSDRLPVGISRPDG